MYILNAKIQKMMELAKFLTKKQGPENPPDLAVLYVMSQELITLNS
jgi:hypothetical protein